MAGYMRKLQGYVYNGDFKAARSMENGTFVEVGPYQEPGSDIIEPRVMQVKADGDAELRVAEKTVLWGRDALVLDVVIPGDREQFFLENEWDFCDVYDCDTSSYRCEPGSYCRMHRLLAGEQLIMTVDSDLAASLKVGDIVTPTSGGSVVKKS